MRYRIKQTDKERFIPQCKSWYDFEWGNIDREDNFVWHTTSLYSICSSLESAKQVITRCKTIKLEERKYPKYFKV
jgi:hypothetical protein